MNHLIEKKQSLLNELGELCEPGYATKSIFTYDRNMIKASKWRIKEWDYYACLTDDYAFSFTIADLAYLGMITVSFLDFKTGIEIKKVKMLPFTFGRFNLPNNVDSGDISFHSNDLDLHFLKNNDYREIKVRVKNFDKDKTYKANLVLYDYNDERMVIATPWKENKKAFYYNQKLNCMPVEGSVSIGEKEYIFNKEKHFSVLDWGRGVWTYKNTWYWGSLSGMIDGKRFGFNIGYGFGDTSQASENMLFYDGKAHKLDEISFHLNENNFMQTWKFTSNDGRFEMTMKPILDRKDHTNLLIIKNFGHQVFGFFSGFAILDDGTKLKIDNLIGFAEKITNHY
ncbi:MAG: DUF2804 domain-containing protein [Bacteroidota bacterium]|nr:DUF2804 domain-containing protein [Bacteroidota bacterium]